MDTRHNSIAHETDTGDVRAIGITGLVLAVAIAIILLLVYGIFQYLLHHPIVIAPANPMADTTRQQFPSQPRIEEHPDVELRHLHSREDTILSTYGWIDKKSGVVRIPIDRAIELQLERGFPVRREAAKK
ncbi:MAG: hypothetical protein ABSF22_00730 [Bryobacteraceae bacterium]